MNCGAEHDRNDYCPYCGSYVYVNVNQAYTPKTKKKIRKKAVAIIATAITLVTALIITIIVISNRPRTVKMNDYIEMYMEEGYMD